jgi:uncharacterized phage protein gp47/JayE
MPLIDRSYPDIVRDLLTNLTQGVTGEAHAVMYDPTARPVQVPDVVLLRRPVRRVSAVIGKVQDPGTGELTSYQFTLNDYELAPGPDDPQDQSVIRFLPFGRKPAPGTDVLVNYYPRTTDPSPLTDVHPGSVVRTLIEAVAKELAVMYAQLNAAYDSAFLDTATGTSLDRVVALLGLQRYRSGRPVGTVRFTRSGAAGDVFIPAGTPVTDTQDKIRYETVETHTMLAGETTAEVAVRGASDTTPAVGPNVLTVIQRATAGLDSVTNDRVTSTPSQDETDQELRSRARAALLASNKGTVGALRDGLLQMPEVKAVDIQEFPDDVAGELRLSISLSQPSAAALPASVRARIEELRPAGVRVLPEMAQSVALAVRVVLTLAGNRLAATEVQAIHTQVTATAVDAVGRTGVGQKVRAGPLLAAILQDNRIADASVQVTAKDSAGDPNPVGADFALPPGSAATLDPASVSFAQDVLAGAAAPPAVTVQVQASIPVALRSGVDLGTAKTQITARLDSFFTSLAPGASVTAGAVLTALRDDAKYAVDAARMQVTLQTDREFIQVAQGGQAFTVAAGQTFTLAAVDVTASGPEQ